MDGARRSRLKPRAVKDGENSIISYRSFKEIPDSCHKYIWTFFAFFYLDIGYLISNEPIAFLSPDKKLSMDQWGWAFGPISLIGNYDYDILGIYLLYVEMAIYHIYCLSSSGGGGGGGCAEEPSKNGAQDFSLKSKMWAHIRALPYLLVRSYQFKNKIRYDLSSMNVVNVDDVWIWFTFWDHLIEQLIVLLVNIRHQDMGLSIYGTRTKRWISILLFSSEPSTQGYWA